MLPKLKVVTQSFLILHGIANHRPPQHWQFLLAAALVTAGHEVAYPALPSSDEPVLSSWMDTLDGELAALSGTHRTVVCHSLSCLLWFHHAALHPDRRVDRVLLAAPPASDAVPQAAESFRVGSLDRTAVLGSAREDLALVGSDADPYNPHGIQDLYGDPLGLRATIVAGAGHMTPADGYGRWDFPIDWCRRLPNPG